MTMLGLPAHGGAGMNLSWWEYRVTMTKEAIEMAMKAQTRPVGRHPNESRTMSDGDRCVQCGWTKGFKGWDDVWRDEKQIPLHRGGCPGTYPPPQPTRKIPR